MHRLLADHQAGLRAEQDDRRRDIISQLAALKRQLTNLADAIAESGGSKTLLDRLSELETQQVQLDHALAEVQAQAVDIPKQISPAQLDARLEHIVAILKGKDDQEKKRLLIGLIACVDVEREGNLLKITIYYYLPTDGDDDPGQDITPDPASDPSDDYVPSSRSPSGPPFRRHIIQYQFIATIRNKPPK